MAKREQRKKSRTDSRTATSSFGVGRREGHDSSSFCARFSPPILSDDESVNRPQDLLDELGQARIFLGDGRKMDELPDNSVALIVTSLPYFVGKDLRAGYCRRLDARPTILVGVLQVWENLYRAVLDGADGMGLGEVVRNAVDVRRHALRTVDHLNVERPTEPSLEQIVEAAAVCSAVLEQLGLDRCRLAASGAGHLAIEVVEFFNALGLAMTEGWGQSELMSAATIAAPDRIVVGTVGPPLPGVEVRVAHDAELLVRSGSAMSGYLDCPARTFSTMDDDGWIRTGDFGEIDSSGNVRVFGRDGEFLTSDDGEVVSLGRVESLLKTHPSVANACVVAGEPGALKVLLNVTGSETPSPSADMKAHVEWANERMSGDEQIQSFATISPAWIPGESRQVTHTGKLRRAFIGKTHSDAIDGLGSIGT